MLRSLLRLCVRPLQSIAVILGAVCRDVEGLALQLLGTHVLGVASHELGAASAL